MHILQQDCHYARNPVRLIDLYKLQTDPAILIPDEKPQLCFIISALFHKNL